ncbi:MAG: HAMP domain-containing sensor histidine kinase [Hyphomicrobium sp.]|nr:HAMP domain-containing sensor histidine kinase [Hyphomicrobium sp.]
MRPFSLRLRLLLAGALSVLLALAIAALGLTLLFKRHVERRVDAELNVHLNQLAANLAQLPSGEYVITHSPGDPRFSEPLSGLYWQIAIKPRGQVLRSRSLWDNELNLPQEAAVDDVVHRHTIAGPGGAQLHLLQRHIQLPSSLGGGTSRLAVGLDAADVQKAVWNFAAELTPFLMLIAILLTGAAWAQVSVGLRPLAAVRKGLSSIRTGASRRLGDGFPDEVLPLAREIDDLLKARDMEIEKAKGRAADLAHGLKTPLQVLHSEARRLAQKGEEDSASEISSLADSMRRHVERELARVRLTFASRDAMANVRSTVDRVLRVIERTPEGQKLDVSIDVAEDLVARIDSDDLAEALGNLVENGARHASSTLCVAGRVEGRAVIITVTDDGAGIPESRRTEALSRGRRLDANGWGAGLGLAIVTDIADAWGGSLSLHDGQPGLIARLCLPSA